MTEMEEIIKTFHPTRKGCKMKPTVEKLSKMLLANNAIEKGFYRSKLSITDPVGHPAYSTILGNRWVGCEVYGKKAMIYISYKEGNDKDRILDVLTRNEIEYSDHGYRVEIRVHWFKGNKWWE
jgi:hypothetical protein